MKIFTNRSVVQKIVIVLVTIMLLTFSVPKPVNAGFGGMLMSPIVSLLTGILDGAQYLLEWAMLGRANYFMDQTMEDAKVSDTSASNADITVTQNIDGALFGLDKANVPDIKYTPEEIFSNRVPSLDINFINPSVRTGNEQTDQKMNVAIKLQPVISGWYVAIRTFAIVGLLSVLVYLGIRMLLTSVAADKAKYKKMLMDWLVAMCLLFALHYIMSFALTMVEVVTSMIAPDLGKAVSVYVEQESKVFDMNLMNYVRFMIQCTDFKEKMIFFFLYLMLVIYSVRFTWTYLKRVVNMAFLTLIAPIVALTYPIDKVSDGKAQAFDMWIKEYVFNALIQPVHLLLYIILLGSAIDLAVSNPLYAIVCLGFILTAEKLLKQMFNFGKATGGTVGSLAAAAGVSALASNLLMGGAKKLIGGNGGGNGKVKTKDNYQRQGRNSGANKGFDAFDTEHNQGLSELPSGNSQERANNQPNNVPSPEGNYSDEEHYGSKELPPEEQEKWRQYGQEQSSIDEQIEQEKQQREQMGLWVPDSYYENRRAELTAERTAQQGRSNELQTGKQNSQPTPQGSPQVQEALQNLGSEEPQGLFGKNGMLMNDVNRAGKWIGNRKDDVVAGAKKLKDVNTYKNAGKKVISGVKKMPHNANVALGKGYKTFKAVAPAATRKVLKTAARGAAGLALGATAGVIGATTGDAEKSISMTGAGFGVGWATGDNAFNAVAEKAFGSYDRSIRDEARIAKYGSAIDARNEMADKAYLKSPEHKEEYEKYFKEGKLQMSKRDYDKAVKEYREAGIIDKKTIRNALKLEAQYKNDNANGKHGRDEKEIRGKVQNIVEMYEHIDKAAFRNKEAREEELKNIAGQIRSGDYNQKRAIANEIFQGCIDWRNI